MKIIKQIDEDTFVISLKGYDPKKEVGRHIFIAHDYVRFIGDSFLSTEVSDKNSLYGHRAICSNGISIPTQVTIDIKSAQKIMMPLLQEHEYMKPEHLADRVHTEDDAYFANHGLTEPRFRKGDKYPAYSYRHCVIHYYEGNEPMVSVSMRGEKEYNKMTLGFFNEFVLPNLHKERVKA